MWRAMICRKAFTTSSSRSGILAISSAQKGKAVQNQNRRAVYPLHRTAPADGAASVCRINSACRTRKRAIASVIWISSLTDESRNTFKTRSKILAGIRQFMVARGMEVETPMMQVIRRRVCPSVLSPITTRWIWTCTAYRAGTVPQASGGWRPRTRIRN